MAGILLLDSKKDRAAGIRSLHREDGHDVTLCASPDNWAEREREASITGGGVVESFPARSEGRRNRGGRDRDDLGPRVTGFGDEVPAFLLRPVPHKATG